MDRGRRPRRPLLSPLAEPDLFCLGYRTLGAFIHVPHRLVNLLPLRLLVELRAQVELTLQIRCFLSHLPVT